MLDALLVVPEVATWARSKHRHHEGPQPLRDRNNPWGFPWLRDKDQEAVNSANRLLRTQLSWMSSWVKYKPSLPMMLIHPEDLGMAERGHPASIWQLPELRLWANKWGLKRYGTFQCHFGPGSWPFPVGILSTHPLPHKLFYPGWPKFHTDSLLYIGPIPRHCRCPAHQHQSDSDFHHRHLRTRSSSLLLDGFATYLMTCWAIQAADDCCSAKLWQRGSDAYSSLVRAEDDSDATDAEQAEVISEVLDTRNGGSDQDSSYPAMDSRALQALGIGGNAFRCLGMHLNAHDSVGREDRKMSEDQPNSKGTEESKGLPAPGPIQHQPGTRDDKLLNQVKKKKH